VSEAAENNLIFGGRVANENKLSFGGLCPPPKKLFIFGGRALAVENNCGAENGSHGT
jgi:hypothetical protein